MRSRVNIFTLVFGRGMVKAGSPAASLHLAPFIFEKKIAVFRFLRRLNVESISYIEKL